jgi:hypothetical protein
MLLKFKCFTSLLVNIKLKDKVIESVHENLVKQMLLLFRAFCNYASHDIMLILVILHLLDCVLTEPESGIQEEQV